MEKLPQYPITKTMIDACFSGKSAQWEVYNALYSIAIPEARGSKVTLLDYPKVSNITSEYIWKLFRAFDRDHHPDVIAGGLWMNRGFAIDDKIPDWYVETAKIER